MDRALALTFGQRRSLTTPHHINLTWFNRYHPINYQEFGGHRITKKPRKKSRFTLLRVCTQAKGISPGLTKGVRNKRNKNGKLQVVFPGQQSKATPKLSRARAKSQKKKKHLTDGEKKLKVMYQGCCCSMFSSQRRGVESKAYGKEGGTLQPDMYRLRREYLYKSKWRPITGFGNIVYCISSKCVGMSRN